MTRRPRSEGHTREVPAGHMGSPDDIANTVVFLASEQASFITGQKVAVNGGRTLL
ncbi:SDR family oxidoreductase [Rhizobium acidisoli]|uniref:SDR family oxidoreductase n=1 Tax=Rhizobium acidisoli TaxID=1538158 RepID=UPI002477D431|nr:SDR family oxidoreductase [Rhizobium acidisoli]